MECIIRQPLQVEICDFLWNRLIEPTVEGITIDKICRDGKNIVVNRTIVIDPKHHSFVTSLICKLGLMPELNETYIFNDTIKFNLDARSGEKYYTSTIVNADVFHIFLNEIMTDAHGTILIKFDMKSNGVDNKKLKRAFDMYRSVREQMIEQDATTYRGITKDYFLEQLKLKAKINEL